MTVYLILIFSILLIGLGIKPWKTPLKRRRFLFISFILLVIISGFRDYSVGVDTLYYVSLFNNIELVDFNTSRYEIGFLFFLRIIHSLTDNASVFLLLSSCICIGITCQFIFKYSDDPLLSILLYILLKPYFFQMTGIRQSIATAFVMLAFMLIMETRTFWKTAVSIIFMVVAVLFHNMAVVAFAPYLLWLLAKVKAALRITPRSVLKWTIIIAVLVFSAYPYIMRLVSLLFPQYTHYFSGTWADANYSASLFKVLIQLVFLIVGVIYLRKQKVTEIEEFALIMIFIAVVTNTLSMRMEIWGRLSGLFSTYTGILFAPMFTSTISEAKNRLAVKASVVVFSLAYLLITFIFRPEWDGVVPYLFRR